MREHENVQESKKKSGLSNTAKLLIGIVVAIAVVIAAPFVLMMIGWGIAGHDIEQDQQAFNEQYERSELFAQNELKPKVEDFAEFSGDQDDVYIQLHELNSEQLRSAANDYIAMVEKWNQEFTRVSPPQGVITYQDKLKLEMDDRTSREEIQAFAPAAIKLVENSGTVERKTIAGVTLAGPVEAVTEFVESQPKDRRNYSYTEKSPTEEKPPRDINVEGTAASFSEALEVRSQINQELNSEGLTDMELNSIHFGYSIREVLLRPENPEDRLSEFCAGKRDDKEVVRRVESVAKAHGIQLVSLACDDMLENPYELWTGLSYSELRESDSTFSSAG